jgi:hypothetical protein
VTHQRLLDAVGRLYEDITIAVEAHCDLHTGDGTTTHPHKKTARVHDPEDQSFTISTDTVCHKASCGKGEVRVGIPATTFPLPLAPTSVSCVDTGTLSVAPVVAATHAASVPAGDTSTVIKISPTLRVGVWLGHLQDTAGSLHRPIVIYLDGL